MIYIVFIKLLSILLLCKSLIVLSAHTCEILFFFFFLLLFFNFFLWFRVTKISWSCTFTSIALPEEKLLSFKQISQCYIPENIILITTAVRTSNPTKCSSPNIIRMIKSRKIGWVGSEYLNGRDHLEDLGLNGNTLKWILNKLMIWGCG